MGILNFLSEHIMDTTAKPSSVANTASNRSGDELSHIEKERINVLGVTTEDMQQFLQMPYHLDCKINYVTSSGAKPYAYIDLDSSNIAVAKSELAMMNKKIIEASTLSVKIPKGIQIPIEEVVYKPQKGTGHTILICTPYTFTGKISKYPLSLSFMTKLYADSDSTHGRLFYGIDGRIHKAEAFCWRKQKGYFFYFSSDGQELRTARVEICNATERNIVYKR